MTTPRFTPSVLTLLSGLALTFILLPGQVVSFAGETAGAGSSPEAAELPWVERYLHALDVDPDNAALRYQLGLALLAAGDNVAAVKEMHRAYPSLSQTVGINFNMGLAYTRLRDPDSAQLYLEQAEASGALDQREIYPLASALYNVALVYLDRGERDAAIEVLRHVVTLAPERRDLMRLYGEVLFQAGRTAEAQEQLLRYLAIYPDDQAVRETLFALHYNRGLELLESKQPEEAVMAFSRALEVAPQSPMARYYLAFLAYRQEQPQEVLRYLAAHVTAFPEDIQRSSFPLLYSAARRLLSGQQYGLAAQALAPLVEAADTDLKYLILAGEVALKQDDFVAARSYYAQVLESDPANADALRNLVVAEKGLALQRTEEGQQRYRQGDLLEAYRLFVEARELDPLEPKLRAYLKDTARKLSQSAEHEFDQALAAEAHGDKIQALKSARRGRELWPDAPRGIELEKRLLESLDLELARQLLEAQSLLAMKEYSRALQAFAMLLEVDPQHADARQGFDQSRDAIEKQLDQRLVEGAEALENGDLESASAAFAQVLEQRPEQAEALEGVQRIEALRSAMIGDELQWARRAFSEGDYAAAREHFQNVLRQLDTPPLRNEYLAFETAVESRLSGLLSAARAARSEHDFRKALRLYRQARKVAADPESISDELAATLREADETMLSLLVQAREAFENAEAGKSVQLLRDVLRIEPSQPQALELLEKARVAARQESERLLAQGLMFQEQKNLPRARKAFEQALQIDPYLHEARTALDKLDLQARKLSEAQVERLYLEGVAFYTRGEYRQAMSNWRKVLEIDKGHAKSIRNLDKAQRKLVQLREKAQ